MQHRRAGTLRGPALLTAVGVGLVVLAVTVYATIGVGPAQSGSMVQPPISASFDDGETSSSATSPTGTPSVQATSATPTPSASATAAPTTNPPAPATQPQPPASSALTCADLKGLKFCDDFNGPANSPPDSSKWRILTGSMWGGQCFRNQRENIALTGQGQLRLTLIDKGTTQCTDGRGYETTVTSGGVDTKGKAYFKYGRFEIRAKLSCAKSVWGAIWMASGSGPEWPQSGEIDFYELFYNKQDTIKHTIHAGNPYWMKGANYKYSEPLCKDYHVYGGEWRPGYIQFTLDGKPTVRFSKDVEGAGKVWPFDTYDLRLLIDLQYGSPGWPGAGEWDKSELPSSMLIDYVRIFE